MDNPYQSPLTEAADPPGANQPAPLWRAVAAGVGVDLVGTIAAAVLLLLTYASIYAITGRPVDLILDQLDEATEDPFSPFQLTGYVLCTAVSLASGWVCGLLAPGREVRGSLVTALLTTLIWATATVSFESYDAATLVTAPLAFGVTVLGGWLAARQRGAGDVQSTAAEP